MIVVHRVSFWGAMLLTGYMILFYCLKYAFLQRDFIILFDKKFSKISQEVLKTKLKESSPHLRAKNLYDALKQETANVENVQVLKRATGVALIKIAATQPLILVKNLQSGDFFVLTKNHGLVDADLYDPSMKETLPIIHIDSRDIQFEVTQPEFLSCAHTLHLMNVQSDTIIWKSKTEIITKPAAYPQLLLVADHKTFFDQKRLDDAYKIFSQKSLKKNQKLKIDLRLDNYIVCAHLKGGGE